MKRGDALFDTILRAARRALCLVIIFGFQFSREISKISFPLGALIWLSFGTVRAKFRARARLLPAMPT